jgi:hypothetical protein
VPKSTLFIKERRGNKNAYSKKKTSTAKKPAAAKKAKKGPDKKAIARAATVRENQVHIQTRRKPSDPKPNKVNTSVRIKLSEGQEKFVWEKAEPVSGTNQAIYRRDVAGAIIKINEANLESEFGWTYALIDPKGEFDDVNNVMALHWMNAKTKRVAGEAWVAKVTGSRDTKDIYNYQKEQKITPSQTSKIRKTTLFQPSVVGRKKINIAIRKEPKFGK